MVIMEMDIKIKLEDADIALLIKSLFEILKKLPKEDIQVDFTPRITPDIPDVTYPYDGTVNINPSITPNMDTSKTTTDGMYYSINGTTVTKMDEEKKNEENQD